MSVLSLNAILCMLLKYFVQPTINSFCLSLAAVGDVMCGLECAGQAKIFPNLTSLDASQKSSCFIRFSEGVLLSYSWASKDSE